MSIFQNILFPTDFSVCAEHAKRYAHALAKESGSTLHVLHVIDTPSMAHVAMDDTNAAPTPAELDPSVKKRAELQLKHVVEFQEINGVQAQSYLRGGHPWQAISELAEEVDAGLIVIGTHGRSKFEQLLFGSTCDKVLRGSKIPVLAVKEIEHEFVQMDAPVVLRKVLFPFDFSDCSRAALPLAVALCRAYGASLTLCYVVDTQLIYPEFRRTMAAFQPKELIEGAEKELREIAAEYTDVDVTVEVTADVPHKGIKKAVDRDAIDLVVIGTHGLTGISHAMLGSTAEKVVRLVNCPVLTVRPEGV